MSINSALAAGTAGLLANSSALAGISDNIANVNTIGYKRVDTVFTPNYKIKGGGEPRYASSGVTSNSRLDVSTEGLLNPASSETDLAVDGNGFFLVRPNATNVTGADPVLFTRSGSFETDDAGFLRNDAGQYLYGWPVASDGSVVQNPSNVDLLEAINLSNIGGAAEATSSVRVNANLQASQAVSPDAATYDPTVPANNMASGNVTPDFQRTIQIFDTQGGVRSVTMSLLKSPTANQWHAELHVEPQSDITTGGGLNNGQIATGVLAFDTNGQIDTANTTLPNTLNFLGSDNTAPLGANEFQWAASTGIGSQSISLDLGSAGNPGGITQFDSPSVLNSSVVNGAVFGDFAGVEVSDDGFVSARFTNGVVRQVFQIPVATVVNPNGLASVGGGSYQVTDESGAFTLNAPGVGGSGNISSKTLENSNVDIATEFSNLISTQRAYSAASKIITTADEMFTTAIQMIR
ncbi:flagellar hook protein [Marinicauda salina]|uniref:Flagellar hook protein FlgE n=1 Tax=Marinicauda salina TaxID=2135793 RepID=A0A2U2BRX6_9PROT|nr:flagellar hook-basal body complex protein [Marinicauda salina]PWE16767.1 flagellar hook protein [Marinicauda salina]